jgi:hypothetical protein
MHSIQKQYVMDGNRIIELKQENSVSQQGGNGESNQTLKNELDLLIEHLSKQQTGGKKSTKKSSANSQGSRGSRGSRGSKSSRKQRREAGKPDPLAPYREFTKKIHNAMELPGNPGPLSIMFAGRYRKMAQKQMPNGSNDEHFELAIDLFKKDKQVGKADKVYEDVKKEMEQKRAAKKS